MLLKDFDGKQGVGIEGGWLSTLEYGSENMSMKTPRVHDCVRGWREASLAGLAMGTKTGNGHMESSASTLMEETPLSESET